MNRSPAHIANILALIVACRRAVHHTRIVPNNQVALVLPVNANHVFPLRCM